MGTQTKITFAVKRSFSATCEEPSSLHVVVIRNCAGPVHAVYKPFLIRVR
jgi:hypothetical protein